MTWFVLVDSVARSWLFFNQLEQKKHWVFLAGPGAGNYGMSGDVCRDVGMYTCVLWIEVQTYSTAFVGATLTVLGRFMIVTVSD